MRDHWNDTSSEEEEEEDETPVIVKRRSVRMVTTQNPAGGSATVNNPPSVLTPVQIQQDDERTRILAEMQAAAEEEAQKRAAAVKAAQEAARQKQQEAIQKAKAQAAQLQAAAKLRQEDARRQAMAEAAQRQAAIRAQTDAAAEQRAADVAAGAKQIDANAKIQLENRQREQAAMKAQQDAIRAQATQAAMLQAKKLAAQQSNQNQQQQALGQQQQQQRPQGTIVNPTNGVASKQAQQTQPIAQVQVRQQPERPSAPTPVQQQTVNQQWNQAPLKTSQQQPQQTNRIMNPTAVKPQSIADIMNKSIAAAPGQKPVTATAQPKKPATVGGSQKPVVNGVPQKTVQPTNVQKQSAAPVAAAQKPANGTVNGVGQKAKPQQATPIQKSTIQNQQSPTAPKVSSSVGQATRSAAKPVAQQSPKLTGNVGATQSKAAFPVSAANKVGNKQVVNGVTASPSVAKPSPVATKYGQKQAVNAAAAPTAPSLNAVQNARSQAVNAAATAAATPAPKTGTSFQPAVKIGQKQAVIGVTATPTVANPSPVATKYGQKQAVNAAAAPTASSLNAVQNARSQAVNTAAAAAPAPKTVAPSQPAAKYGQKQAVNSASAIAPGASPSLTTVKNARKDAVKAAATEGQVAVSRVAQKHVGSAAIPKKNAIPQQQSNGISQQTASGPTKGVRFGGAADKQSGSHQNTTQKAANTNVKPGFENGVTWIVDDAQQGKPSLRTSQQTAAPSPVIVPAPFRHASPEALDDGNVGLQSSVSNSSIARARMSSVDPTGALKKKIVIDDEVWLAQRRIPQEQVIPYQPEKIQIPEFAETVEVKPTVIVPVPSETTRVKWEFPEAEELDRETVPRVKAQDWVPQNEVEHVVTKTTYAPSKIGQVWPPPHWAEKETESLNEAKRTKATEDVAWIQHGFPSEQAVGTSPWSQKVTGSGVRERQWPPTAFDIGQREFTAATKGLALQWPPPEFEEQKQAEIEVIQTHLPVKANSRQWPPPQYGNEENALVA